MDSDNSRTNSIKRSGKSVIKLADILVREGVSVVPGGGLAYDAAMLLGGHLKQYYVDQRDERLITFHETMLSEDPDSISTEDVLKKEFSTEDYYSLVSACIQDNEAKKTRQYGWLMRNIIAGRVSGRYKVHFLRALKELTAEELEYARKVCIYSTDDMMTVGGVSAQLKSILRRGDDLYAVQQQSLERHGLLRRDTDGGLMPSDMLKEFLAVIFGSSKLTPISIGRNAWTGAHVFIADCGISDGSNHANEISDLLFDRNIKASIGTVRKSNVQQINLFDFGCIILQKTADIPNDFRSALAQLKTKVIVKIITQPDGQDKFPEVTSNHTIICPGDFRRCLSDLSDLIDQYINSFK